MAPFCPTPAFSGFYTVPDGCRCLSAPVSASPRSDPAAGRHAGALKWSRTFADGAAVVAAAAADIAVTAAVAGD